MQIKVAVAQLPVRTEIEANVREILAAIDFARTSGADILLTPEGSLSGYTHLFDGTELNAALQKVVGAAAEGSVGLALGTCMIEGDGLCYNELRFYGKDGELLGFHSKTLTCGSWETPPRGEIEHFHVSPLRTFSFNGITIGGLVCNDLWANPLVTPVPDSHLSQQLSRMGAKVIFHAVNGGRDDGEFSTRVTRNYHESNLLMRALAGELFIVTTDNCLPLELPTSSWGGVVGPEGAWLMRLADRGAQMGVCTIDVPGT
jgi:predicted amidohydrolase